MANFIKDKLNTVKKYQTGFDLPDGTSAERPSQKTVGEIRWNTDIGSLEVWDGSAYSEVSLAGTGVAAVTVDDLGVGDGSTVAFTLGGSVSGDEEGRVIVAVGNVYQNPLTAYTLSGTTITFSSAPGIGEPITVVRGLDGTSAA